MPAKRPRQEYFFVRRESMEYKNRSFEKAAGVPAFSSLEFSPRQNDYALLIPVINEGDRIINELRRAEDFSLCKAADIILLDGGSTDGSTQPDVLVPLHVNSLLVITGEGRQGAAFRAGFFWALERGYQGLVTVDGNNKDSVEDTRVIIKKLKDGYDFVQGSRYHKDGKDVRTPLFRKLSIRLIHAPVISYAAGYHFTDTTNAFRGYSRRYLTHEKVQPLRDIFMGYELLDYLSVRASQIGLKVTETGVTRTYPPGSRVPTKIRFGKDHFLLLRDLFRTVTGYYNPAGKD